MGHVQTCSTFPGSAVMPCSVKTYSRYKSRFWKRKHFFGLSFSPAQASRSNTCFSRSKCVPHDNHVIKSNQADCPMKTLKTSSINLSNVLSALQSPKGITFHSYKPLGVTNAAFSWVDASIATCQYPETRSNVENHLEPLKAAGDKLLMNKFIRQNFGGGLTLKKTLLIVILSPSLPYITPLLLFLLDGRNFSSD